MQRAQSKAQHNGPRMSEAGSVANGGDGVLYLPCMVQTTTGVYLAMKPRVNATSALTTSFGGRDKDEEEKPETSLEENNHSGSSWRCSKPSTVLINPCAKIWSP